MNSDTRDEDEHLPERPGSGGGGHDYLPAWPGSRRKDVEDRQREARQGKDEAELGVADWLICIFCSGIGCVLGIVWLISGNPKGGKVLGLSLMFGFMKLLLGLMSGALKHQ